MLTHFIIPIGKFSLSILSILIYAHYALAHRTHWEQCVATEGAWGPTPDLYNYNLTVHCFHNWKTKFCRFRWEMLLLLHVCIASCSACAVVLYSQKSGQDMYTYQEPDYYENNCYIPHDLSCTTCIIFNDSSLSIRFLVLLSSLLSVASSWSVLSSNWMVCVSLHSCSCSICSQLAVLAYTCVYICLCQVILFGLLICSCINFFSFVWLV